jgi:hypothetical protein
LTVGCFHYDNGSLQSHRIGQKSFAPIVRARIFIFRGAKTMSKSLWAAFGFDRIDVKTTDFVYGKATPHLLSPPFLSVLGF